MMPDCCLHVFISCFKEPASIRWRPPCCRGPWKTGTRVSISSFLPGLRVKTQCPRWKGFLFLGLWPWVAEGPLVLGGHREQEEKDQYGEHTVCDWVIWRQLANHRVSLCTQCQAKLDQWHQQWAPSLLVQENGCHYFPKSIWEALVFWLVPRLHGALGSIPNTAKSKLKQKTDYYGLALFAIVA